MLSESYDAVVVGAGPAGCAAAILLGRSGLRVALLEAHKDPGFYKRLCSHSIRAGTLPTIKRLGIDSALDDLGAVRHYEHCWTEHGWFGESATDGLYGYNVRRMVLDPVMRATAAGVPDVDLMMGARVRALTRDDAGRVDAVVVDVGEEQRRLTARLVVGADGYASRVAELADLPGRKWPNKRLGYLARYRDVGLPDDWSGAIWFHQPDISSAFRNDDGVTVLVAVVNKKRLSEFREDRETALLATFDGLPDAPDMTRAQRVSDVIGTNDYPSITRRHIVAPGVALIGDAAMVGDPLWGTGCGWAMQTAEWLVDAVAEPLRSADNTQVDAGARRYQWQHRRRLLPQELLNIDFSRRQRFTPLERLMYAAAARDQKTADRIAAVGRRTRTPMSLLAPNVWARAAVVRRRSAKPAPSRPALAPATGTS
jgi:menaquinone-9 beta-reductase